MKLLAITSIAVIAYKTSAHASAISEEADRSQLYLNTPAEDRDNVPTKRNLRSDVAEGKMAPNPNPKLLQYISEISHKPKLPQNIGQRSHQEKARFSFKNVPRDQQRRHTDFAKILAGFQQRHQAYDENKMLAILSKHYPDDADLAAVLLAHKKDTETWLLANGLEKRFFTKLKARKVNPGTLFDRFKLTSTPEKDPLFSTWIAFVHSTSASKEKANMKILNVLQDKSRAFKSAEKNLEARKDFFAQWTAIAEAHFKPPKRKENGL